MNNVFADGTIVVCEKVTNKENIKNGDIVVALLDGYTNIKRFYESEGVVSLVPDSKDKSFMPIIINPKVQNLRILGKVIWHMNPDDIMKTYWGMAWISEKDSLGLEVNKTVRNDAVILKKKV